jgi:drug/metabolite transporter (DMT)-like permease
MFGVLNNVSLSMMSFAFPGYPPFINYFPAIVSLFMFLPLAIYRKEEVLHGKSLTFQAQKQYFLLGILTAFNWGAFSYSAAWVDGNLQQILSNVQSFFVFFFSIPILGLSISKRELLASFVIFGGVLVGMIPTFERMSEGNTTLDASQKPWFNAWYFISAYVVAIILQALQFVYQERAFRNPYLLDEASCLFWYSLQVLFPLILMTPLESLAQVNATTENRSFAWAWPFTPYYH